MLSVIFIIETTKHINKQNDIELINRQVSRK